MNIVFFDITVHSPYADCVCLDNHHAISSLYHYVEEKGKKGIAYITRENTNPSSYQEREQVFQSLSPNNLFAKKIFDCLMEQNFNHLNWKADIYRVQGEIISRS